MTKKQMQAKFNALSNEDKAKARKLHKRLGELLAFIPR